MCTLTQKDLHATSLPEQSNSECGSWTCSLVSPTNNTAVLSCCRVALTSAHAVGAKPHPTVGHVHLKLQLHVLFLLLLLYMLQIVHRAAVHWCRHSSLHPRHHKLLLLLRLCRLLL